MGAGSYPGFARPADVTDLVLDAVALERLSQYEKWGEQNHPDVDQVLLNRPGGCTPGRMAEEYEIPPAPRAKALCRMAGATTGDTWAHILVEEVAESIEAATLMDKAALKAELIQVAAVAVAWVEKLMRAERTN